MGSNLRLLHHSTFILGDQLVITGYYVITVRYNRLLCYNSITINSYYVCSVGAQSLCPLKKAVLADQGSSALPCNALSLRGGCAFILYHLSKLKKKRKITRAP